MAHALDVAARRWPHETRSRLLLRLVEAGRASLEEQRSEEARNRLAAIDATCGKYADVFTDSYLADLRQDWPE